MYESLFGYSCIENQVLAILKQLGIDISILYNNSA